MVVEATIAYAAPITRVHEVAVKERITRRASSVTAAPKRC